MGGITFDWLSATDGASLLAFFWLAAIVELPRYLLPALYVFIREMMAREPVYPTFAVKPGERLPTVSMLLPGHNEGGSLERAVAALREQTRPPNQIVVIDDGSTDDMAKIGHRLQAEGRIDIFVSTGLRGGKSAAHNLGLTYCTGDIVVVADIDTSLDRDALERVIEPFQDPSVGAVSGNIGVRNACESIVSRFQAIQYIMSIGLGRRVNDLLFGLFIASGAFAAFRHDALLSIGGWSAGPGEDGDVSTRIRRAGWKVRFQPDAWAMTDVPATLTGFLRQRARWNRSFAMLRMRKHAQILNPLQSNFSFVDAIGTIDAVYFELVCPFMYIFGITSLFVHLGTAAFTFLAVVMTVYMLAGCAMFTMACALAGNYSQIGQLPFLPGVMLFTAVVQRPATVYAYLTELLWRKSYTDTFVPGRVLKAIDQY